LYVRGISCAFRLISDRSLTIQSVTGVGIITPHVFNPKTTPPSKCLLTEAYIAQLILKLMLKDDFPQIWVPDWENRDLRQLLWHRHRMVQARTRIMNQLQAVALNEGLRCKKRAVAGSGTRATGGVPVSPVGEPATTRSAGVAGPAEPNDRGGDTDHRAGSGEKSRGAALAFVLIIGRAERFQCGKQIASYLGLVPSEESSGDRRRLGHISKQGNALLRFLLVEAAQVTVRSLPAWRSKDFHLAMRRGRKIAKVAMARKLAIQLYWMMRKEWDYEQVNRFGPHAGQPENRRGVQ
jgi:transposase